MAKSNTTSDLTTENQQYLIDGSAEKSVGQSTVWARRLSTFPALQNRNYRIYFFGQFVSVIGTWLQIVAQGWLVLQLSNSAFMIGLVAALATAPALLFSLFGGVVVDRFPKKKVLNLTQSLAMIFALTLGTLTLLDLINIPTICILAFCLGTVNAIDAPARQAFVSQLVTKDQLPSAIALNSAVFNSGRVIGPGLAGILIAITGSGGAFIFNGLSYLAIIIALRFLRIDETPSQLKLNPLKAIREGLQYAYAHPIIKTLLILTGMNSIFAWSYSTIMPLIAREVFMADAKGLGYLYTATGLGSLLATFLVGAYSKRIPAIYFIVGGNSIFSISLILFAQTSSLPVALFLLFFTGLGLLCQAATMNTIIQGMVKNEFRGRVMSLYVLMFLGLAPLGNFLIGWMTDHLGISTAITINAIIILIVGGILLGLRKSIIQAYRNYRELNEKEVVI